MDDWRKKLRAGDKLIFINKWSGDSVRTISRATKTLVIFDNQRINRNSMEIREATNTEVSKIEIDLRKFSLIQDLSSILNVDAKKLTIKNLIDAIKALKT